MAASTAARNGRAKTTIDETAFPVDSFRDAAVHLRRPFTTAAVKFKVQATWPKDSPTGGLVVAYIDARLAVERLNLVCPHLWRDEYRALGNGLMWCDLTVDGITRSDVGEGQGKGLVSDALKRAAVKFGVGVSLYAIPQSFIGTQDGSAKPKRSNKGPTLELTPAGERAVRDRYADWLADRGVQAFGEPLDHGDVEDAQGDHEADTELPAAAADAPPADPVLTDAQQSRVIEAITAAGEDVDMLLSSVGCAAIEQLTVSQAKAISERLKGGASA